MPGRVPVARLQWVAGGGIREATSSVKKMVIWTVSPGEA